MTEITDVWNTQCVLTNKVLTEAKPVDLGLGEQIFLVEDATSVGSSERYYAQNKTPTVISHRDDRGNVINQTRQHSLEIVFHQAEIVPPQGANARTSTLQCVNGALGQQIKEKVGWERNLNA